MLTLGENLSYPGIFQQKLACAVGWPNGRSVTNLDSQTHGTRFRVQFCEFVASNEAVEVAAENSGDWNAAQRGASQLENDEGLSLALGVDVSAVDDQGEEEPAGVLAAC